jgi:hypothetical protein
MPLRAADRLLREACLVVSCDTGSQMPLYDDAEYVVFEDPEQFEDPCYLASLLYYMISIRVTQVK